MDFSEARPPPQPPPPPHTHIYHLTCRFFFIQERRPWPSKAHDSARDKQSQRKADEPSLKRAAGGACEGTCLEHFFSMALTSPQYLNKSLEHFWNNFGTFWNIPGSILDHPWHIFGTCLEHFWNNFSAWHKPPRNIQTWHFVLYHGTMVPWYHDRRGQSSLKSDADDFKDRLENSSQIDEKSSQNGFPNQYFFRLSRRRLSASIRGRFGDDFGALVATIFGPQIEKKTF